MAQVAVQPNFKPAPYLGEWFEIAAFPQPYTVRCTYQKALYTKTSNPTQFGVTNTCLNENYQVIDTIDGTATVLDPKEPAIWAVVFPSQRMGLLVPNYIVHRTNYIEYSVVGTSDQSGLWILSRTQQMSDHLYRKIVRYCATLGYEISKLVVAPGVLKTVQTPEGFPESMMLISSTAERKEKPRKEKHDKDKHSQRRGHEHKKKKDKKGDINDPRIQKEYQREVESIGKDIVDYTSTTSSAPSAPGTSWVPGSTGVWAPGPKAWGQEYTTQTTSSVQASSDVQMSGIPGSTVVLDVSESREQKKKKSKKHHKKSKKEKDYDSDEKSFKRDSRIKDKEKDKDKVLWDSDDDNEHSVKRYGKAKPTCRTCQ